MTPSPSEWNEIAPTCLCGGFWLDKEVAEDVISIQAQRLVERCNIGTPCHAEIGKVSGSLQGTSMKCRMVLGLLLASLFWREGCFTAREYAGHVRVVTKKLNCLLPRFTYVQCPYFFIIPYVFISSMECKEVCILCMDILHRDLKSTDKTFIRTELSNSLQLKFDCMFNWALAVRWVTWTLPIASSTIQTWETFDSFKLFIYFLLSNCNFSNKA